MMRRTFTVSIHLNIRIRFVSEDTKRYEFDKEIDIYYLYLLIRFLKTLYLQRDKFSVTSWKTEYLVCLYSL